ncbi:hypothetical protein [Kordia sp.]|uniref:hypothetical protein n=1 Tax=Kordia sp. TaxID=1965332 RepID=UPI003D2DFA88
MKKRNVKLLKLRKNSISHLNLDQINGGLVQITKFNICGSQIDACPSALGCTFLQNCQTLNNTCQTFNYVCQSLVECPK